MYCYIVICSPYQRHNAKKDGTPCLHFANVLEKGVRKAKLRIQRDKLFKFMGGFKMEDSLTMLYVTCSIFNQSWCTQGYKMHVILSSFLGYFINRRQLTFFLTSSRSRP